MDPNNVAVALAAVAFVGLSFGTWRQAKIAATTLVEKEYEVCGWLDFIVYCNRITRKANTNSHAHPHVCTTQDT